MGGPSWQGPMQRQIHASRGPHWNKQSYATGGPSRDDKFHSEFMIVVRDMVSDVAVRARLHEMKMCGWTFSVWTVSSRCVQS